MMVTHISYRLKAFDVIAWLAKLCGVGLAVVQVCTGGDPGSV